MSKKLTQKQKIFCHEYISDWNGARAYKVAYLSCKKDSTARSNSSKILTNTNIQEYIGEIKDKIEENIGITKQKVVNEYLKIAFSSIADLHQTWIDLKKFESLTNDQKACIQEIQTRTETIGDVRVTQVKLKLYDKQKALESIGKMLGYDAVKKIDITTDGESLNNINITVANRSDTDFQKLMKKRNE